MWTAMLVMTAVALSQGEPVIIATPSGASLAATYTDAGRGTPGVILFSMCRPDAAEGWTPVAERLRAAGVSSLMVAARGVGGSRSGPNPVQGDARVEDVAAAVADLQRRIGSHAPIGVAGSSCGVAYAMIAATHHPGVRAVVAFTGPHAAADVAFIRETPHLAVFSGAAELDGPAPGWARELKAASANPASRVELVPGKAHGTDAFATHASIAQHIADWLAAVLKSAA